MKPGAHEAPGFFLFRQLQAGTVPTMTALGRFWEAARGIGRWSFAIAGILTCVGVLQVMRDGGARLPRSTARSEGDAAMYLAIVAGMRDGDSYYQSAGRELVERHYATYPVFNWRLPTLAWAESQLPPAAWISLMVMLGAVTASLWGVALRPVSSRIAVMVVVAHLAMLPAWMNVLALTFHDFWAGELIACSLACHALGRRRASLVTGTLALAIRELALVYVMTMAFGAWWRGRHREAAVWAAVIAVFGLGYLVHAHAVDQVRLPTGLHNTWMGWTGWLGVIRASDTHLLAFLAPRWLVAMVLPWFLVGLWRYSGRARWEVALTATAFAVLIAVAARPDNWYWGWLLTPILPAGLAGWASSDARAASADPDRGIGSKPHETSRRASLGGELPFENN